MERNKRRVDDERRGRKGLFLCVSAAGGRQGTRVLQHRRR